MQRFSARHLTRSFIGLSALLLLIGIVFIYSSSSFFALQQHGSSAYYVKRHVFGLLIGCIAAIIMRLIPLWFVHSLCPLVFWAALGLTGATLLPTLSVHIHGSSRWLRIGSLVFQPSELLKLSYIVYLAYLLAKHATKLRQSARGYIPFLLLSGIVSVLLLKQPDFGLTITLAVTTLCMLFVAGARIQDLTITAVLSLPIIIGLVLYKPYRLKRILTFLNPWADPQGSGFQIIQSLIAIGSGGATGVGIAQSQQKFLYLPMQHTDFIFSIIAEETGFVGVTFLIGLYMLFLYTGIKLAWSLHNSFYRYTVCGCTLLLSLQTIINCAVASGLAPTKGIGLPFISYGNTGLVCTMAMLGLIINMAHNDAPQAQHTV